MPTQKYHLNGSKKQPCITSNKRHTLLHDLSSIIVVNTQSKEMSNTRRSLWKSIKRGGKEVVSTASAASTAEESGSCGTSGSGSKQTLTLSDSGNTDEHELCSELIKGEPAEKYSGPVDEIIIQPSANDRLAPDGLEKQESLQYHITEDGRWRLKACRASQRTVDADYGGPVDVDAYIQDDSSASTTSEERREISAIKRRLQSRHASKVPRQIVLCDNNDYENNLAGYDDDFGTLFDDVYHNSYPFDEAARDKCVGEVPKKTQTHTRSFHVKVNSCTFDRAEFHADEFLMVSSRSMAPNAFEC